MSLPDNSAWHYSQYLWHKRRRLRNRRWHGSQAKWHMARVTFSWIVSNTLRKHAPLLAQNISRNNSLLERLTNRGLMA